MFSSFSPSVNNYPVSRLPQYAAEPLSPTFTSGSGSIEMDEFSWPLSGALSGAIGFQAEQRSSLNAPEMLPIAILEQMPQGVAVFSPEGEPLYVNHLAHQLCGRFTAKGDDPSLWQRIVQDLPQGGRQDLIVQDLQPTKGQVIRLQWMPLSLAQSAMNPAVAWLLLLEDRNAKLLTEMRQEQARYSLTEREAQIWVLLKLGHSYQDIADQLGISLNTVKTHVKNVYVKRRNHTDEPIPQLFP